MISQLLVAGILSVSPVSYTIPETSLPQTCSQTFLILPRDWEGLRAWRPYSLRGSFETITLFNAMMNGVCLRVVDKKPAKKWKLNRVIG